MRYTIERVASVNGDNPIACHVTEPASVAIGTAVLIHGRNGAGRAGHMQPIADAYLARNWRVVAPDLPRSHATENSGPADQVTLHSHQLEAGTVLDWVQTQFDHGNPSRRLAIAGHSLGAYAIAALGGENKHLDHLIAVSPVLSGRALLEARRAMGQPAIDALRREAPDMYAQMENHDAIPALRQIEAPLAVMTGSKDALTPPAAARRFFEAAPGGCYYSVLTGLHHCPTGPIYEHALTAALDSLQA